MSDNNLIYSMQFGFKQKYSTVHALISLAENIRKILDEGNIGCHIFMDLQKAFSTVEHDIFYQSLNIMVYVVFLPVNGLNLVCGKITTIFDQSKIFIKTFR